MIYSGFEVEGEPYLAKPAARDQLIEALKALVAR